MLCIAVIQATLHALVQRRCSQHPGLAAWTRPFVVGGCGWQRHDIRHRAYNEETKQIFVETDAWMPRNGLARGFARCA